MIFVDTSVWITAFRASGSAEATHLTALLDTDAVALTIVTKLELQIGAIGRNRPSLRRVLSALPAYVPSDACWPTLDDWTDAAARAGERFGVADLLVGAIAAENEGEIWSLDRDFARMETLGFVTTHRA